MKRLLPIIITAIFILISETVYSLNNFNYKGIALDNTGEVLPETSIDIRITISDESGTLYQETHTAVMTDQFGFFTIEVGTGTIVSGNLGDITVSANTRISSETRTGGIWILSEIESFSMIMRNPLDDSSDFAWNLEGNAGITPGTNFIGTTDDAELQMDVRNGGTVEQSLRINTDQTIYRESGITGNVAGNERGDGSVDLQISRTDATQVASGDYSTVGGGKDNTASGDYSIVGGGSRNTASRDYATVGGGFRNSANGDYSTVGGGEDNTASGDYSTVGGGSSNTASGNYSTVGGDEDNTASGDYSTVGGGEDNTASGDYSIVGGGFRNTASGDYSTVGGGFRNSANGDYSTILGGSFAVTDKYGQNAYASGQFDNQGDAQTSLFVVRNITVGSTDSLLNLNGNSWVTREQMTLNDEDAWTFKIFVVGKNNDGSVYGSYEIRGVIINNGGTLAINGVSSETDRTIYETDSGLDATAVINGTALAIQVTGISGETIRWVARVEVAQINY